jgi:predicted RND superfamily exporter protein
MKALFQLFSVPVAVLALTLMLGIVGGVEKGLIPYSVAVVAALVMIGIEYVACRVIFTEEVQEDGEDEE